jgi:hypothetical protein
LVDEGFVGLIVGKKAPWFSNERKIAQKIGTVKQKLMIKVDQGFVGVSIGNMAP